MLAVVQQRARIHGKSKRKTEAVDELSAAIKIQSTKADDLQLKDMQSMGSLLAVTRGLSAVRMRMQIAGAGGLKPSPSKRFKRYRRSDAAIVKVLQKLHVNDVASYNTKTPTVDAFKLSE